MTRKKYEWIRVLLFETFINDSCEILILHLRLLEIQIKSQNYLKT